MNILLSAVLLAVSYVSAIFLGDLIGAYALPLLLVYSICTAAIYGLLLLSRDAKTAVLKWVCSLPFAFLCLEFFWQTNFYLRALNWVSPDYGKPSAGAGFAGFVQLVRLSFLCLIAGIAGICFRPDKMDKIARWQRILGGIWGIGTVIAAIWLERVFPPYSAVLAAG